MVKVLIGIIIGIAITFVAVTQIMPQLIQVVLDLLEAMYSGEHDCQPRLGIGSGHEVQH